MNKKLLVWFDEVDKNDIGLVGGKGANLGEMTRAKFPVPFGFVVTSNAYFEFIKENKLDRHIKHFLGIANFDNPNELHEVSKNIQRLILHAPIPTLIVEKIIDYYDY